MSDICATQPIPLEHKIASAVEHVVTNLSDYSAPVEQSSVPSDLSGFINWLQSNKDLFTTPLSSHQRVDIPELVIALTELDRLVGVQRPKLQAVRQVKYYLLNGGRFDGNYRHTMIMGEPGTGKTTLARALMKVWVCLGVFDNGPSPNTSHNNSSKGCIPAPKTSTNSAALPITLSAPTLVSEMDGGAPQFTGVPIPPTRLQSIHSQTGTHPRLTIQQVRTSNIQNAEVDALKRLNATNLNLTSLAQQLTEASNLIDAASTGIKTYTTEVSEMQSSSRRQPQRKRKRYNYQNEEMRTTMASTLSGSGDDEQDVTFGESQYVAKRARLNKNPHECTKKSEVDLAHIRTLLSSFTQYASSALTDVRNAEALLQGNQTLLTSLHVHARPNAPFPFEAPPQPLQLNLQGLPLNFPSNNFTPISNAQPKPEIRPPARNPTDKIPGTKENEPTVNRGANGVPFGILCRADLVAGYSGQTTEKAWEKLSKYINGVVFITECHSLCHDDRDAFGKEAIQTILQFMDAYASNTVVMFDGYPGRIQNALAAADEGFMRRIQWMYRVDKYTPQQMAQIALLQANEQAPTINVRSAAPSLSTRTADSTAKHTSNTTADHDTSLTAPAVSRQRPWKYSRECDTKMSTFFHTNMDHFPNSGGDSKRLVFLAKMHCAERTFTKPWSKMRNNECVGLQSSPLFQNTITEEDENTITCEDWEKAFAEYRELYNTDAGLKDKRQPVYII